MSRSLVNRGLACRITATPPMITKSTPPSVSRCSRSRSWSWGLTDHCSGVFTATPGTGQRQHAGLGVHGFDLAEPFSRRQFQVLANQALIHTWATWRCLQPQAMPGCPERIVKSVNGGIGVWSLQLGYGSLADPQSTSEVSLSEAG